ncbi:MAG: hypothetical protein ABIJ21_01660 [Nanoarchaeota archaeon]
MKKRGLLLIFCIVLLFDYAHAESLNVTTEGSGFIYVHTPDSADVDTEFVVSGTYYFLNQLLVNASVAIVREGTVFGEQTFPQAESAEFSIVLHEMSPGTYTYDLLITETNQNNNTYSTRAPFVVSIGREVLQPGNVTVKKGIVKGAEEQAFDDLSAYEQSSLKGNVSYRVTESDATMVACVVPDNVVIFTPEKDFSGEARCVVKATQGNVSKYFIYDLLVGSSSQVLQWEAKPILPELEDAPQSFTPAVQPTDKSFAIPDLFSIEITTNPDPAIEGASGTIRMRAKVESQRIEKIAYMTLIVGDENITKADCPPVECVLEIPYTFNKQGKVDLFPWVGLDTRGKESKNQAFDNGWTMFWENEDLVIYNPGTIVYVRPKVEDLAIPPVGVITDPDIPDARLAASVILQEYQRKKRIPLNLDEELQKIKEFAKHVEVRKFTEKVVRLDANGDRQTHTVFHIEFIPKEETFTDFLLGKKRYVNIQVFEHIAKDAALDLGHVRFNNPNYEIIVEDPLVVWHFDELSDEITYEVDKETESLGNTIVSGEVKRGFPNIVFAIFLLPIVIVIIVYFDRFKKHPLEEIAGLRDRAPDYREIEEDTYHPQTADVPADEKPPETVQNIKDFDKLIDAVEAYIKHRVQEGHAKAEIRHDLINANWPDDVIDRLIDKHSR